MQERNVSQKCQDEAVENLASCASDDSMAVKIGCCSTDCSTGIKKVCHSNCLWESLWGRGFCQTRSCRPRAQPASSARRFSAAPNTTCPCPTLSHLPSPQSISSGCFNEYAVAICNDPKSQNMMTGLLNAGVRCANFTSSCAVRRPGPVCTAESQFA